jgi:hypothetical protein
MGLAMSVPQLLIILVIVALVVGTRRLKVNRDDSLRSRLHQELSRMPVYSAETTNGKEAEFIRDRLPKRFPTAIVLVVVVISGAVVWWLTR